MNTITMAKETMKLWLALFTIFGAVFGYVLGRMHQMQAPKQRRPRRTPEQRHTRSHW